MYWHTRSAQNMQHVSFMEPIMILSTLQELVCMTSNGHVINGLLIQWKVVQVTYSSFYVPHTFSIITFSLPPFFMPISSLHNIISTLLIPRKKSQWFYCYCHNLKSACMVRSSQPFRIKKCINIWLYCVNAFEIHLTIILLPIDSVQLNVPFGFDADFLVQYSLIFNIDRMESAQCDDNETVELALSMHTN